MTAIQAIPHSLMKMASLPKDVASNLNKWEMTILNMCMIWRDLCRDRVMIIAVSHNASSSFSSLHWI
jgi:hypothetical protein